MASRGARLSSVLTLASAVACAPGESTELAELQQAVEDLEAAQMELAFQQYRLSWPSALLTVGSQGFTVIDGGLVKLTVSIEEIVAFANGSTVTLRLGNPSSALIAGFTMTVGWGLVDAEGTPVTDGQRTKTVRLTNQLQPGSWNDVEVILEGLPVDQLGFVQLSGFTPTAINLR